MSRLYGERSRARHHLLQVVCDDWPSVRQIVDSLETIGLTDEQAVQVIDSALKAYHDNLGHADDRGRLRVFCLELIDAAERALEVAMGDCGNGSSTDSAGEDAELAGVLIPERLRWVLES